MRIDLAAASLLALVLPSCVVTSAPVLRGHRDLKADEREASSSWAVANGYMDGLIATSSFAVYVRNGSSISALSLSGGGRLWTAEARAETPTAVHYFQAADPYTLWLCYPSGPMLKLNASDGAIAEFNADVPQCGQLFMTPDGKHLVSPYNLLVSGFKVIRASSGYLERAYVFPVGLTDAVVSPDGKLVVAKTLIANEAWAFRVADGMKAWRMTMPFGEFICRPFFSSDPSVWYAADTVSGVLRAFRASDGRPLWVSEAIKGMGVSPSITASADGRTLYLGKSSGGFAVLDAEDGSVARQWQRKPGDIGDDGAADIETGLAGALQVGLNWNSQNSKVPPSFADVVGRRVYYAVPDKKQIAVVDLHTGETVEVITGLGSGGKGGAVKFLTMAMVAQDTDRFLIAPTTWQSPKGGKVYKIPVSA